MTTILFFVPGVCVPQPRPQRAAAAKKARVFSNTGRISAFKLLARQAYQGPPLVGGVWLYLAFQLPRPVSLPINGPRLWHITKPDCDNLSKSIMDAICGIYYVDDGQVCFLEASKRIMATGEEPGVTIKIKTAE